MIFVTGATGFIGTRLCAALARLRRPARCLVRDLDRAQHLKKWGFELVLGDLRHPHSYAEALAGCASLVHLASTIGADAHTLEQVNHRGTQALVAAAQRAGVRRFVHVSSYGAQDERRFPYARSEWRAERCVRQSRLDWVVLRPTVVVGPGDTLTTGLLRMVRRWPVVVLPNGGALRLQPLWVGDLVSYLLNAVCDPHLVRHVVPVAGGRVLRLRDVAGQVMSVCHVRKPILSLPRKPLKFVARKMSNSPWESVCFLSRDAVLSAPEMALFKRSFADDPRTFESVVAELCRT